jgi:hypothetical protein
VAARRKRPALGIAGAALWRRLTTAPAPNQVVEFMPSELTILELACKTADDIAALEATLAGEGVIVSGSKGQLRINGAVPELRLQRAALAKLVQALEVDEDEAKPHQSQASRKASAAAQARWRNHERKQRSKHGA